MLQYKIPQNVGIEDKIVGPFTLKQILILAVGGGVSYLLFTFLARIYELNVVEYFVIALPALISVAFALIRINDIPLPLYILYAFEFAIKPKRRVWDHRAIAPLVAVNFEKKETKQEMVVPSKKSVDLDHLSRVLDSGGLAHLPDSSQTDRDIDDADDRDLLTQAFFGRKTDGAEKMYWRVNRHDRGKRLDLLAKTPLVSKAAPPASQPKAPAVAPNPPAIAPKMPSAPKPPIPSKPPLPKPLTPPAQTPKNQPADSGKRKRNQSKANQPPVRPNTQINHAAPKKPVTLMPAPKPAPKADQPPKPQSAPAKPAPSKSTFGELRLEELKQGEIEINLD